MLYSDPSGHLWETLFDIGSLAWSTWDLITNPSWENAGWFTLDVLGLAIPFIPSPGALKAVKWLNRGENLVDGLRTTKTVTRAANWAGDAAVIVCEEIGSNVLSSVDSIMASINDSLAAMKRTSEALAQKNKNALIQRITTRVVGDVEIRQATDFTREAQNLVESLDRSSGYTRSSAQVGIKIHSGYHAERSGKEFNKIAGMRMDFVDIEAHIVKELKPNNPQQIRLGIKQLNKYADALEKEFGVKFDKILELY